MTQGSRKLKQLLYPFFVAGLMQLTSACGNRDNGDGENQSEDGLGSGLNESDRDLLSKTCQSNADGSVTVKKRWRARATPLSTFPNGKSDGNLEDLRANFSVQVWRAGGAFGNAGNIGYSNNLGDIVNGAPVGEQPLTVDCNSAQGIKVGWRFSNNVSGLTNSYYFNRHESRFNRQTGITTQIDVRGNRVETYIDPRKVAPFAGVPSKAYYDELASSGNGRIILTKKIRIGSEAQPNRLRITRRESGRSDKILYAAVYTDGRSPMIERWTRRLSDKSLRERLVRSGLLKVRFDNGVEVTSEPRNLLFKRPTKTTAPFVGVCAAVSGSLNHQYRQPNSFEVVTVRESFSHGRQSARVACRLESDHAVCLRLARRLVKAYATPSCLY